MKMLIRNMPDDLHRVLKIHAAKTGESMQDIVVAAVAAKLGIDALGREVKKEDEP